MSHCLWAASRAKLITVAYIFQSGPVLRAVSTTLRQDTQSEHVEEGATNLGAKSNRSLARKSKVPNGGSVRDIESRRHCLSVIGLVSIPK